LSSGRRHTILPRDWSSDVCSSDHQGPTNMLHIEAHLPKQLHLGTMIYRAVGHPHTTQLHAMVIMVRHKLSHRGTQSPHNGSVLRSEERRVVKDCRPRSVWYRQRND